MNPLNLLILLVVTIAVVSLTYMLSGMLLHHPWPTIFAILAFLLCIVGGAQGRWKWR